MRNETDNAFVLVDHDNRRAYVRVRVVQPLDFEPRQVRIRGHHRRVGTRVVERLAVGRVVAGGDALRDDVAVGYGAEVAAVPGGGPYRAGRRGPGPTPDG